jgi:prophage regulatory protein
MNSPKALAERPDNIRVLHYPDLRALKGIPFSRMHIWRLEKNGQFPKHVLLTTNTTVWLETEIDAWLAARIASRDRGESTLGARTASQRRSESSDPEPEIAA